MSSFVIVIIIVINVVCRDVCRALVFLSRIRCRMYQRFAACAGLLLGTTNTLQTPHKGQSFYLWPEGGNPRVGTPSGGIRENGAS